MHVTNRVNIKYLFLLILLVILSGCDVNYEVHITKDFIKEKIDLCENIETAKLKKSLYGDKYFTDLLLDIQIGYEYYTGELNIKDEKTVCYNYNEYEHLLENYQYDTLAFQCYDNISLFKENGKIVFETSGFNCYDYNSNLDNVVITLTSDYKVLEHNANEVNNNKYIWKFDKDNLDNANINLILSDKINKSLFKTIFVVSLIIFILIIGLIYILKKNKYKKIQNKL